MNLSIKNTLKTLKNTRQQVAEILGQIETLKQASGEAATAAALLGQLRTEREDALAESLVSNKPSDTTSLDENINEATARQALLDDRAGASKKAIAILEKTVADLQVTEANQLDSVFASYFDRSNASRQLALEKTKKHLAEFKEAAAELSAYQESCSIFNRGSHNEWRETEDLLYTRYDYNQTLRDLTKDQTGKLLSILDGELIGAIGLTLWQIRMNRPRGVASTTEPIAATEKA